MVVIATPVLEAPPAPPVQSYSLPDDQAKAYIYLHESGNNPFAVNPTSGACGLAQAYPCSKMHCILGDYACEDAWATQYMLERYGSWLNAYNHWLQFSSW